MGLVVRYRAGMCADELEVAEISLIELGVTRAVWKVSLS